MILYVNFAVSDLEKSASFYDKFLAEFDAKRYVDRPGRYIAWGRDYNETALSISPRSAEESEFDSQASMIAFAVDSKEEVDRLFAKGQELGATVAMPVKLNDRGSYAGVLSDFDGHKMRLLCITA